MSDSAKVWAINVFGWLVVAVIVLFFAWVYEAAGYSDRSDGSGGGSAPVELPGVPLLQGGDNLGDGPSEGGDLDCADIGHPVAVSGPDPHGLDRDGDGVGCEGG